jgi:hypothetical protein
MSPHFRVVLGLGAALLGAAMLIFGAGILG